MNDILNIQSDFPLLSREIRGDNISYLDSAASTLKPQCVIDALSKFYASSTANVHRGAHFISDEATGLYEGARTKIAQFLNAKSNHEIIFTRGTTEAINLVAQSLGTKVLLQGDVVLISEMEHHSNIIPWQMICEKMEATLKVIPILENGDIDIEAYKKLIEQNSVKILSITHCSNTLGTVNDIKFMCDLAKSSGAYTVVDAAQSISFLKIDVQKMGCDFLAFSGHKLFAPFGIGILYGDEKLLNELPPYQGGGSMISEVSFEKSTYLPSPQRFEAGTPNVAGAYGLGIAIDYLNDLDFSLIHQHEKKLVDMTVSKLSDFDDIRFIGTSDSRSNIVSFVFDGIHPSDIGHLLDQQNVAVRTGHHCTQPLMAKYDIPGTIRASFSIYSVQEDVERLITAVKKAKDMLS